MLLYPAPTGNNAIPQKTLVGIVQAMINSSIARLKSVFAPKSVLYIQPSSVTVANTISELSLLTTTVTIPANFLVVGKQLQFKISGYHSATGNPNIRIRVRIGLSTILDTGNISSGNSTNAYFETQGLIECRSIGVGGTVAAQGFYLETGGGSSHFGMVNTSPVTVNTTIDEAMDITIQWGTASPSNTITSTNGYVIFMQV